MSTNAFFHIAGGAGKNIMATAVVQALKKQQPETSITILSPHADIWRNNPVVDELIDLRTSAPSPSRLRTAGSDIYMQEVYLSDDFVNRRCHLIEAWCRMYDIPYNGELPSLYYTDEEKNAIKSKLPSGAPLFMVQISGGAPNQQYPISWMRDMPLPIAQDVVNKMNEKGFTTVHLRRPDQYPLSNTVYVDMTMREMMGSLLFSEKRLFIDSLAQHAGVALKLPSVVTWGGNRPEIFGYDMHTNILPTVSEEHRHYIDSFFDKWNITGSLHECPWNTNEIYAVDEILTALENQ